MSLIVIKFGGTSLGGCDRICQAAEMVAALIAAGHRCVVVCSAMAGITDHLVSMASSFGVESGSDYDLLLSTGEHQSIALFSMALQKIGLLARPFRAEDVPIMVDSAVSTTEIASIHVDALLASLERGVTPVVAGFQGVDAQSRVVTLGRGGSDLTAVAMAAVLEADECRIMTDVAGVHCADPRVIPRAALIEHIDVDAMMEMSSSGAKVLHDRCLSVAKAHGVVLTVASTAGKDGMTTIGHEVVSGTNLLVASHMTECCLVTIADIPSRAGLLSYFLSALAEYGISMRILQVCEDVTGQRIIASMHDRDWQAHQAAISQICLDLGASDPVAQVDSAMITVLGARPMLPERLLSTTASFLSKQGISVRHWSTSATKITFFTSMADLHASLQIAGVYQLEAC